MNYTKFEVKEGQLLICEIDDNYELDYLEAKFKNHNKFSKITNQKRKKEWLLSRFLLEQAGVSNVDVSYTGQGKPVITHQKYKYISISHSRKMVGVFLHSKNNVGLDIESTNRRFEHLADKYLSKAEQYEARIINNGLALMWCIKEAAYKIANISGISFEKDINISVVDNSMHLRIKQLDNKKFYIKEITIDKEIIVCIVQL